MILTTPNTTIEHVHIDRKMYMLLVQR